MTFPGLIPVSGSLHINEGWDSYPWVFRVFFELRGDAQPKRYKQNWETLAYTPTATDAFVLGVCSSLNKRCLQEIQSHIVS